MTPVLQTKYPTSFVIIKDLEQALSLFGYPRNFFLIVVHKHHSIKLRNTTPYSPWSKGEVERFNRSLKKTNQCAYAEGKITEKN